MQISKKGIKLLHDREGLRLKPYLDTKGIPTIAFGNTFYANGKKVTMLDKPLTMSEASKLGDVILGKFVESVDKAITSCVNQNQFNACVSFAYNIGINGFRGSLALKLINVNPNNKAIGAAFLNWSKPIEIVDRRKSEVKQYFENV